MSTQPTSRYPVHPSEFRWGVTEEAVTTAVERLVKAIDPLRIVAFGSRAKETQRLDSDLDIAVILDPNSPLRPTTKLWTLFDDLNMTVDMIVADEPKHLWLSTSINSVHHSIAHEGVVLYQKGGDGLPDADAIEKVSRG
jgi:predicted nucleotidyltransferase